MRSDVEFKSKGVNCRGWLYRPDEGKGPWPIVIMAGGWCYVKEIVMPQYAEFFIKAGLAVLIFDYRGFGGSDGEPRQHVDPNMQIEDYKNAVSFVETVPDLDSKRVGIWGISYSGGHVLAVGATDPRVKCIVSVVPVIDGHMNMVRAHGTEGFRRLQAAIAEDRTRRFKLGVSEYIPMTAVDHHQTICTWPYAETNKIFLDIKNSVAPAHEHRNTIESVELLETYNVLHFSARILGTPTLMIIAENDDLTPWDYALEAFRKIKSTVKKAFILRKITHMSIYSKRTDLETAAEQATDWFSEYLIRRYE